MLMEEQIRQKLVEAFAPTHLEVIDQSEDHRGHGGFREGVQTHFKVVIRAGAFNGLSRVAQQRLIYKCLEEELADSVHALALGVSGS